MAAAKSLNLREGVIQCLYTQAHRVGIIDNPGRRRIFLNVLCNFYKHGNSTQSTYDTTRSGRIPYRLINTKAFRRMYVNCHFIKATRQNRNHNKIRPGQSLFHIRAGFVLPFAHSLFSLGNTISNLLISLCRFLI